MAPAVGRRQPVRPPALLSLSCDDTTGDGGGAGGGAEVFSMSTPAGCGAQEFCIGTPQGHRLPAAAAHSELPEPAQEPSQQEEFAAASDDVPWRVRRRPASAAGKQQLAAAPGLGAQVSQGGCPQQAFLAEETAELLLEAQLEAAALSAAEPFAPQSPSPRRPAGRKGACSPSADWSSPGETVADACSSSTCSPSTSSGGNWPSPGTDEDLGRADDAPDSEFLLGATCLDSGTSACSPSASCGGAWPSPGTDEGSGRADDVPDSDDLHGATCPQSGSQTQIVDLDLDGEIEL